MPSTFKTMYSADCVIPLSVSDARYRVLDIMDQCQSVPRPKLKDSGPVYSEC